MKERLREGLDGADSFLIKKKEEVSRTIKEERWA